MEEKPRIESVLYTTPFLKAFKKLPQKLQTLTRTRETLFLQNPFLPFLLTHKLHGDLRWYWSYSINYHYRVLFRFIDDHTVTYYDIGTHDIYK